MNRLHKTKLSCFKAYDVRGRVPEELNEELAYQIARAYSETISARQVVIGHDVRLSSPALKDALVTGLLDSGVDVIDIGLCGTEEIYFATFHLGVDGGLMITASHNPPQDNGIKFVRQEARPVSRDSGLAEVEQRVINNLSGKQKVGKGRLENRDIKKDYLDHLLKFVDVDALKPLKIVVNSGNGCAGPIVDLLAARLPFIFERFLHEPDGTFPHGVPNPLLFENRTLTGQMVQKHEADLGIAWDGDFDRCFFYDEEGRFIDGYYLVGFLAEALLARAPGGKIIHDPRLFWNTQEVVQRAGGVPIISRAGHSFMKESMRTQDALYGGEMSGHHFFRDFAYCDSGMIPWLLVAAILSSTSLGFAALVSDRMAAYPVSGEINRQVHDIPAVLRRIEDRYRPLALGVDYLDGVSMHFASWRFNVRPSNTEPLIRLNVEARKDRLLLEEKTSELLSLLMD